MAPEEDRFESRDLAQSLLIVVSGLLVLAFVVLSFVKGSMVVSPVVYVLGGLVGLFMLFIGVNGVVQSLRAPRDGSEEP